MRRAAVAALSLAALVAGGAAAVDHGTRGSSAYGVSRLVADEASRARYADRLLVNAWGLASSPTGPWWTSNEASGTSTLYGAAGRKQLLTVTVDGGPTGLVYYGGKAFRVRSGRASDPARFIYACEDGKIRAWSPTVPSGWSTRAEVVVDAAGEAAVFRGLALAGGYLYATDFHNGKVDVYDGRWRRVARPGAFVDRSIPAWFAPFGIVAAAGHLFVTYVGRAPVNGNDAPTGGYVDEFDGDGHLIARVARRGALNAPWGIALAPPSFGRFGGDLLVGNFGDGHINAYRRSGAGWTHDGLLRDARGLPLTVSGLWGLAFGNDGSAGSRGTLYFTSGPHRWRGETELGVHGLLGAIAPV